jgi:predicted DsbA family dithiol-disulfide isomerase
MGAVRVTYVTDPACPWSWAAEPTVRRVQTAFGAQVRFTYVMGGLAREVGDGLQLAGQALEAQAASGMPVDARGFLLAPPRSTFPACLAVKAAQEQGDRPAAAYLRRLRVGVLCRRRPQDTADALVDAARDVPGLDAARLARDLESSAILEAFGADLEAARGAGLPAFFVEDRPVDHDGLERAVRQAGAEPGPPPSVEELLVAGPPLAAPEVAAACGLPALRAQGELWRLALELRARPEPVGGGGALWHPA